VGVSDQRLGNVGGDPAGQLQALPVGPQCQSAHGVVQGVAEVEGDRVEVELAGLDLGEVEDVVDDRQQGLGRRDDRAEVFPLAGRQLGVEGQFGHADDAVHRGADLVAHVGQELALGPGGRLGRLAGAVGVALGLPAVGDLAFEGVVRPLQLGGPLADPAVEVVVGPAQGLLRALPVVDVGAGAEPLCDGARPVADRDPAGLKPSVLPVGGSDAELQVVEAPPGDGALPARPGPPEVVGVEHREPAGPVMVGRGHPGVIDPLAAEVVAIAPGRGGPDQLRHCLGEQPEPGLTAAQLLLGPAALGDLALEGVVGPLQLGGPLAHPLLQVVVGPAQGLLRAEPGDEQPDLAPQGFHDLRRRLVVGQNPAGHEGDHADRPGVVDDRETERPAQPGRGRLTGADVGPVETDVVAPHGPTGRQDPAREPLARRERVAERGVHESGRGLRPAPRIRTGPQPPGRLVQLPVLADVQAEALADLTEQPVDRLPERRGAGQDARRGVLGGLGRLGPRLGRDVLDQVREPRVRAGDVADGGRPVTGARRPAVGEGEPDRAARGLGLAVPGQPLALVDGGDPEVAGRPPGEGLGRHPVEGGRRRVARGVNNVVPAQVHDPHHGRRAVVEGADDRLALAERFGHPLPREDLLAQLLVRPPQLGGPLAHPLLQVVEGGLECPGALPPLQVDSVERVRVPPDEAEEQGDGDHHAHGRPEPLVEEPGVPRDQGQAVQDDRHGDGDRQQPPRHQTARGVAGDRGHQPPVRSREQRAARHGEHADRRVQRHLVEGRDADEDPDAVDVADQGRRGYRGRRQGQGLGDAVALPDGEQSQRRVEQHEVEGGHRVHAAGEGAADRGGRSGPQGVIDPQVDTGRVLEKRQTADGHGHRREAERHAAGAPAPPDRPERGPGRQEAQGRVRLHGDEAREDALQGGHVQRPSHQDDPAEGQGDHAHEPRNVKPVGPEIHAAGEFGRRDGHGGYRQRIASGPDWRRGFRAPPRGRAVGLCGGWPLTPS